jgi:hypothetical protein
MGQSSAYTGQEELDCNVTYDVHCQTGQTADGELTEVRETSPLLKSAVDIMIWVL